MELISTVTVGAGGQPSITFGPGGTIPQTYDDLLIVTSLRTNRTGANAGWANYIAFNGSEANITNRELRGTGSTAFSDASSAAYVIGNSSDRTANTFGNSSLYIPNYRSNVAKSFSIDGVEENNGTAAIMTILAGLWNQTAAITSITIRGNQNDNLLEGSSASLYGIRKFNTTTQPKATGGAISYDAVNQKWVHVFTASGTFTPTQNLTGVEYLVVAGGGAGGEPEAGGSSGGGGGAGGYRSSVVGLPSGGGASAEATLSLTSGVGQTVTVGAGGSIGGAFSTSGNNGSNSVFGSITATGGGRGQTAAVADVGNGGSGGGGAGGAGLGNGGTGTTAQGFAGGNQAGITGLYAAGGGGAGAVGQNTQSGIGGAGGAGVSSTITGTAVTRAAGGGGGTFSSGTAAQGGAGGGGNGAASNSLASTAGAPNSGSGGGGGARLTTGARMAASNGGSGIVIVRYS